MRCENARDGGLEPVKLHDAVHRVHRLKAVDTEVERCALPVHVELAVLLVSKGPLNGHAADDDVLTTCKDARALEVAGVHALDWRQDGR